MSCALYSRASRYTAPNAVDEAGANFVFAAGVAASVDGFTVAATVPPTDKVNHKPTTYICFEFRGECKIEEEQRKKMRKCANGREKLKMMTKKVQN